MSPIPAPPLHLHSGDRDRLETILRKRTAPQRAVLRARIVLLCAKGLSHRQIKRRIGTTVDTVILWRRRYEKEGMKGLKDRPRPGRPSNSSPQQQHKRGTSATYSVANETNRVPRPIGEWRT